MIGKSKILKKLHIERQKILKKLGLLKIQKKIQEVQL